MNSLNDVLKNGTQGLYYGNRILLPFKAEVLKIVIGSEIIVDFSKKMHGAHVRVTDYYTEIYFLDYNILKAELNKYDVIKVVVVQQGEDLFDFNNHIPLELKILNKHELSIKRIEDDIIFIE